MVIAAHLHKLQGKTLMRNSEELCNANNFILLIQLPFIAAQYEFVC